MPNLKATDIMNRSVLTFTPETDIYQAIQTLLKKRISGAPVVDRNGNLQGVLSELDCLKVLTAEAFDGVPQGKVADYMSSPAQTTTEDSSIFEIVRWFLEHPIRRLPVVDGAGRLVGQISRRDVLVAIGSIRDNSYLYGTREEATYPPSADESPGVNRAMKIARGHK